MSNLETIIGIEIHIELNTKTKMFSPAPNQFHSTPNTNVSSIDLAYPGTLPLLNKRAVEFAIMLGKALDMEIDNELHFDRKNYFYPDLPKGFQISQLHRPIGTNGKIPINNKIITIERIQLEEDTARSNHNGTHTTLDYNRAGTPLIEIVSNPDIRSKEEAVEYIDQIRKTVRILGISDAKMEEGSLRADINISLRPQGSSELLTRVEIKNLNSLSNVVKAIDQEIKEQTKIYLNNQKVLMATKRFDEATQNNILMRVKMEEADYRFFEEPNIPIIKLEKRFIDQIKIPELPWEIDKRYSALGVEREYIQQLINDPNKLMFINSLAQENIKQAIKIYFSEIVSYMNKNNQKHVNISSIEFQKLINKLSQGELSGTHVKKIIPILIETKKSLEKIIKDNNLKLISNISELTPMIDRIIVDSKEFIESNQDRKERVVKYILGQLMKMSKGQADPIVAVDIVNKKIGV